MNFAKEINAQFDRLCVGDHDSSSGVIADTETVGTVLVYDDHASGIYDAPDLLEYLETLSAGDVSLDSESPNNIWQHMAKFEV